MKVLEKCQNLQMERIVLQITVEPEESQNNNEKIIVLTNEEGEDVSFEFLDSIGLKGKKYVVLYPIEEDDGQVVILEDQGKNNAGENDYVAVEDEEILNNLYEIFKSRNKNTFNFDD